MNKAALVSGFPGQDSKHLIPLLLNKGYFVKALKRRTSGNNVPDLEWVRHKNFQYIEGDVTDFFSVNSCIKDLMLTFDSLEIYNLAAQSHVHTSFAQPKYTFDVNFNGVLNLLESIRPYKDQIKFYQASTSEMFGDNYSENKTLSHYLEIKAETGDSINCNGSETVEVIQRYQNENTPFSPMSPYAVAKVAAHHLVNNYRKAYGLHASCGILFNHEGEYRGEMFLTQKVCKYVAELKYAKKNRKLKLGNLDSYRDFGYAADYVEAMWLMLQEEKPDDYVIATGNTYQIRDFVKKAFAYIGEDWQKWVEIDESLKRPSEVDFLKGDASKAKKVLGWESKVGIDELIKIMIDYQYARIQ